MRKLKLQVQMSVDGFIAGPEGEMDWMTWNWDNDLKAFVDKLTRPVDCILLGRKMSKGFVDAWSTRAANPDPGEDKWFANKMIDTPKIVFSHTLLQTDWPNTTIAKGDIVEEVNMLKQQQGGDMIVYGGADFDASLIQHGLIDDYYLFINPAVIGEGMSIFKKREHRLNLKLVKAYPFSCGIVVLNYQPA